MYLIVDKSDSSILFAESNKEMICLWLKNHCTLPLKDLREGVAGIDIGESLFVNKKNKSEEGYLAINRIPSIGEAGIVKVKINEL